MILELHKVTLYPVITCSDAAIPTITLIMGANLLKGKDICKYNGSCMYIIS